MIEAAVPALIVLLTQSLPTPSLRTHDKFVSNSGKICDMQHPMGLPSVYTTGSNFKCIGPGGNSTTYSDGDNVSGRTSVDDVAVALTARDVAVVEVDRIDDVLGDSEIGELIAEENN